jgi:hypothetical protein
MSIGHRKVVVGALVLLALLVISLVTPPVADATTLWSDLPDDLLASYGLTRENIGDMSNGYLDGTWRPYDYVTRGQFVSLALMYVQMNQLMAGLAEPHFSDVPRSAPHFLWVEAGFDAGLVEGYQTPSPSGRGVFGLYDPISREQVVTILGRYLSKMDLSRFDFSAYTAERSDTLLAPFVDKDRVLHRQEVAMALDIGVLQPPGAALMPEANLTRIQAAALIVRAQSLLPPPQEPPTVDWHYLSWLMADANAAGIAVDSTSLGAIAPWMPRTLALEAKVEEGQDLAVYEDIAERLVSLAEQYKDVMQYEQVRIVLNTEGGVWVYDHTFEAAPPTSTSAAT